MSIQPVYHYILLGGDGYYGRNFKAYLGDVYNITVIDKKISLDHDLMNIEKLPKIKTTGPVIVINFAAISFVDYSITNPEETILNNLMCCQNGWILAQKLNAIKYIYISTDEVNVLKFKDFKKASPYVQSKKLCEDYLNSINTDNIIILRPVNLMGNIIKNDFYIQQNSCLLKKISLAIKNKECVYVHGKGNQKRMFMNMGNACRLLKNISEKNKNSQKIYDVANMPSLRTQNLKIKDIIYYLSNIYHFDVVETDDPRKEYQDDTYLKDNTFIEINNYRDSFKEICLSIDQMII